MKIKIGKDEIYPVYYLSDSNTDYRIAVETSEEAAIKYRRISKEWEWLQRELEALYEKSISRSEE